MSDNKTASDRITRIEQRTGAVETDHVCVWEMLPGESPEQASERARLAGFPSIGLLVPRDAIDVGEWERVARAREQHNGGNDG